MKIKSKERFDCYKCKNPNGKLRWNFLCYNCWMRTKTKMPSLGINIKEGQEKVRNASDYVTPTGQIKCSVSLPKCYIKKKVRVIVVEENEES